MHFYNPENHSKVANSANKRPLRSTMLLIFVILFPISGAETTTEYSEGFFDTTMQEDMIEATTEETPGISTSNPYAKYIFGLPPIPVDPSIKGVESDDDFETLAPFTREQVYNKNWFLSGFDKENRPILFKSAPRLTDETAKQQLNATVVKLLRKLSRYRKYITTKAVQIRSTKEKPVTQYVAVVDYINLNSYSALTTNSTFGKQVKKDAARDRQFYEKFQNEYIILNGKDHGLTVLQRCEILFGVVGELFNNLVSRVGIRRHVQAYGPDKATWLKALQKQFPRDQLPEEFGGFKGHVPIKLYPD